MAEVQAGQVGQVVRAVLAQGGHSEVVTRENQRPKINLLVDGSTEILNFSVLLCYFTWLALFGFGFFWATYEPIVNQGFKKKSYQKTISNLCRRKCF